MRPIFVSQQSRLKLYEKSRWNERHLLEILQSVFEDTSSNKRELLKVLHPKAGGDNTSIFHCRLRTYLTDNPLALQSYWRCQENRFRMTYRLTEEVKGLIEIRNVLDEFTFRG